MSPIVYVVVGGAFAVFALLVLTGIIVNRLRRKDARRAVQHLQKRLAKEIGNGKYAEINPIAARPLSIEMTKEAAAMSGYEFVDFFNRNGSELMRFRAAPSARRGRKPSV